MKISKIELKNFKYFDDLTIDLPEKTEVVLLVGPNGVGKSCIFEAIHNIVRPGKKGNHDRDKTYFSKDKTKDYSVKIYDENHTEPVFQYGNGIPIKIYGRTAYRFTKDITRSNISQNAGQHVKTDQNSPDKFTDLDQRIEDDIEAALGVYMTEVQKKGKKTDDIIDSVIKPINKSLKNIFGGNGIQLETILNPFDGKGSAKIDLLFVKNNTEFLYKNLSAGEKEIFDIIFNFYRRVEYHISDGIYYIDEPELHINTSIQGKLLKELIALCKKFNTQLWIATHSVGFLSEAKKDKKNNISIVELSAGLAKGKKILKPSKINWQKWQKILTTPLDNLATLTLPNRIIYCEGDPNKTGFDEKIYNTIFGFKYPDTIFISSGGRTQPINNSLLASVIFCKLSADINLLVLKDRDVENINDSKREAFLKKNTSSRMLSRLELENYLFDFDVLRKVNKKLTQAEYSILIPDPIFTDMKPLKQKVKKMCGDKSKTMEKFMEKLALKLPSTSIYDELNNDIFK